MCKEHEGNNIMPEHECTINHEGGSGAMESAALLDMLHFISTNYPVNVTVVLTDDDSTMRAVTQWSNADYARYFQLAENQHTLLCVDCNAAAGNVLGRVTKVTDTVYQRDENGDIAFEEYGDKKYKIVLSPAKYEPAEDGEVAVTQHPSHCLVNGRPIIGYRKDPVLDG